MAANLIAQSCFLNPSQPSRTGTGDILPHAVMAISTRIVADENIEGSRQTSVRRAE